MNIREIQEEQEVRILSPYACYSINTKGRKRQEEPCTIRTTFQRDRDRILHCKSFRRLKHKTQVFISPEGDHYRTRLTHTLEVAQIARTIAKALQLNEDLTEAIALAHDLGHTPFGHTGEELLNQVNPFGFRHYEQSLRVVEVLEREGQGLNLTWEVQDGILNHPTKGSPSTLEGKVVQIADKIAYINHDIDDALRGQVLRVEALPREAITILGETSSRRIHHMVCDIVKQSYHQPDIIMSEATKEAMYVVRQFMFEKVYIGSKAKAEDKKAQYILKKLYQHFICYPEELSGECREMYIRKEAPIEQVVCDYIAGMTDRYAMKMFEKIYIPTSWNIY